MGLNLLLLVCMYPVLPIMYISMRSEANHAEEYVYGVKIPLFYKNKEEIQAIQTKYDKMLKRITLILAIVPLTIFGIPYFSINFTIVMMWMLLVVVGLEVPYALGNRELKRLKKEKNYTDMYLDGIAMDPEEDDQWILGMFYYNPKDRKTLVNKRAGIGTTVNMAKPIGKGLMLFVFISLLSIPAVCVWLCMEEFIEPDVKIENQAVVATHLREDYRLPLNEIESVDMIDALPSTYKKNGTSMDNLKKGTFRVEGYGTCELFLNPNRAKYLVIVLPKETVILSDRTDEETIQLYHELTE